MERRVAWMRAMLKEMDGNPEWKSVVERHSARAPDTCCRTRARVMLVGLDSDGTWARRVGEQWLNQQAKGID